jgi:molecular chaperone DnaJ
VKDYYLTLGVPVTATPEQIDAAFRRLAAKWHPDMRPGQDAAAVFKSAAEAHEILSDVSKRKEYDRAHGYGRRRIVVTAQNAGAAEERVRRAQGQERAGAGGSEAGHRSVLRGSLDIHAQLEIAPEEAIYGSAVEVRLTVPQICFTCQAQAAASDSRACPACGGSGTVCHSREVRVQVPPRVANGNVLRVVGWGKAASPKGPSGDLYLRVRIRPYW